MSAEGKGMDNSKADEAAYNQALNIIDGANIDIEVWYALTCNLTERLGVAQVIAMTVEIGEQIAGQRQADEACKKLMGDL